MAKAAGDAYSEIIIVGAVGLAMFWLMKRGQQPAVAFDAYGQPISPAYGVGSLGYPTSPISGVYGPAGQADTIPNIINAVGNLFNSTANGATPPMLQPSLPLGSYGVTNPPPYY